MLKFNLQVLRTALCTFTCVLSLATLSGCNKSETNEASAIDRDPEIARVIQMGDNLQQSAGWGWILGQNSERDREGLMLSIRQVKNALIALMEKPGDHFALSVLQTRLRDATKFHMLLRDQNAIEEFFSEAAFVLHRQGELAGFGLAELEWPLFAYLFSEGLYPFDSFAQGRLTPWATRWLLAFGRSLASVRGNSGSSVLVSPAMDLSQVSNPQLRLQHDIMINQGNRGDAYDPVLIAREAFQVWVSTEKFVGEDWKKVPVGSDDWHRSWKRINHSELEPMPVSHDFQSIFTPRISLEAYRSSHTRVALVLDVPSTLGNHWPSWTIYRFEVFGLGPLTWVRPSRPLHSVKFDKRQLDAKSFAPFCHNSFVAQGASWKLENPIPSAPDVVFGLIDSNRGQEGVRSNAWLISPAFVIGDQQDLFLQIRERNRRGNEENMKMYLLEDSNRSLNPEDLILEPLVRTQPLKTDGSFARAFNEFEMSNYKNQRLRVGFHFTEDWQARNESTTWQIEEVAFSGVGRQIEHREDVVRGLCEIESE